MIPDSDTVAAPSRMFSTNIRYGRSALESVNTCRVGEASWTTSASTSPLRIARSVSSASLRRASTSVASTTTAVTDSVTAAAGSDAAAAAATVAPAGRTRGGHRGNACSVSPR